MSGDRVEKILIVLVLLSAASVLLAPVVGRQGAPGLANLLMVIAAGCGLAAFGVAGAVTFRAARRAGRSDRSEDES